MPGSPLVLTHKIKLVPSGSGPGSCGCDGDFAALRERLESLEREVSDLREKCGETGGSCCTSESKGNVGSLLKVQGLIPLFIMIFLLKENVFGWRTCFIYNKTKHDKEFVYFILNLSVI